MNLRRGLLLAGINLAVAVPMILMMEARDQEYALTQEEIMAKAAREDAPGPPETPTPEPDQPGPEQATATRLSKLGCSGAFYVGFSQRNVDWKPTLLRGISRTEVANLEESGQALIDNTSFTVRL